MGDIRTGSAGLVRRSVKGIWVKGQQEEADSLPHTHTHTELPNPTTAASSSP